MTIFKTKNNIQLAPVELTDDFKKQYGVSNADYICLSKDSEPIRDVLYRKGGMFFGNENDNYFILFKCVPTKYTKEQLTMFQKNNIKLNRKEYLKDTKVIIDSFGNELAEFDNNLNYPTLIKKSVLYKYNNNIFSLLDNSLICECGYSNNSIETDLKYITKTKDNKCYMIDKQTAEITIIH